MKIMESAQNYLETIYMLQRKIGSVRSIDIAHELSFSKPSVSVAMKNLRQQGYVCVDENGEITLTKEGMEIAMSMYEKHTLIAKALMASGGCEETAYKDSCKIAHDISDESFEKIKDFIAKHQ